MGPSLSRKLSLLRGKIRKMDSALIAYSGGLDSAFLLRICREELGDKAVGITIMPDDYPKAELIMARRIAKVIGVRHVIVDPSKGIKPTLPSRKGSMCIGKAYRFLKGFGSRLNFNQIVEGSQKDDERKGSAALLAAREAGFKSPLLECDLSKAEIRMIAKEMGLPDWDHARGRHKAMLMPVGKRLSSLKRFIARSVGSSHDIKELESGVSISGDPKSLRRLAGALDRIQAKAKELGFSDVSLRLSS